MHRVIALLGALVIAAGAQAQSTGNSPAYVSPTTPGSIPLTSLATQAPGTVVGLGSDAGGPASPVALTLGSGLSATGGILSATGGSVTSASVVPANGFAGTVATATTTPAITLSTSITGPLKGNGTALQAAVASDISTLFGGASGTGTLCLTSNCILTTPTLGAATGTSFNGNFFTTGTYTLTGAAGKTLTFNNTLTLGGTDSTTMTLPATSQTLAGLGVAQTFTAEQTINNSTANQYSLAFAPATLASGTTGHGINIVDTVNDASAVDGIVWFSNTTCTACTATSYLADLQVASASVFNVSTTGAVTEASVNVTSATVPAIGIYKPGSGILGFSSSGATAGKIDVNQHWRIGVGTPTIASGACGAATNGTLSAAASDHSGEVIIGAAATTTCTITFGLSYTTAPRAVILTAGNAAAIGTTVLPYISSISTANFVITGSLLASTSFYYWVQ